MTASAILAAANAGIDKQHAILTGEAVGQQNVKLKVVTDAAHSAAPSSAGPFRDAGGDSYIPVTAAAYVGSALSSGDNARGEFR
ncbi:hypothetical protein [Nocardia sp. NPDC046763]|uniref:hypothetical protein n=1 Tax=Nocardia sp. NPDC046763 TaxID=3155256 RepID=UPI0033EA3685